MARQFLIVTPTDTNLQIAQNIKSREQELMAYDFERANHEAAIAALGNIAWDDTTIKYRNLSRDVMIARATTDGLDSDAIQRIADLQALDYHTLNLEAVKTETAKSERAYDNLLTALPAGPDRDAAFAALAAKDAAQPA